MPKRLNFDDSNIYNNQCINPGGGKNIREPGWFKMTRDLDQQIKNQEHKIQRYIDPQDILDDYYPFMGKDDILNLKQKENEDKLE